MEWSIIKKIEEILERTISYYKGKLHVALDRYEYLTKLIIIIIFLIAIIFIYSIFSEFIDKNAFFYLISIIISIISLVISYLGLKTPKCNIHQNVKITNDSGIFIELYSQNKSSCIVSIDSIILLDEESKIIDLIDVQKHSKNLPKEILKSYILRNNNISTVPLVYIKYPKFDYEVKTYINLASNIQDIEKNNDDKHKKVNKLLLRFKRFDDYSFFDVSVNFEDVAHYTYH